MKIDGIPVVDGAAPIPIPPGMYAVDDYENGVTSAGGYVFKWMRLRAGQMCMQHVHPHAHATLVTAGAVDVWLDAQYLGRFDAMQAVNIESGSPHRIVAVSDATFVCVHYLPEEV